MNKIVWISGAMALVAATALGVAPRVVADEDVDFGLQVQRELNHRSEKLLGTASLRQSALGPYTAADSTQAIQVAPGLHVSLVSSAVHSSADMIALWPDDRHPTHLFVCDEGSSNPAVQRVDLSQPAASNAVTILTGIVSCDPIRRTPWGSLTVAEEATDGGTYEIMNPLSITSPIAVTNRAAGTTTDARVVKRKALGQLAFEGNPVLPDGTVIFGDELRPGGSNPGGAIYKFVPDIPYAGAGIITVPGSSPFVSGQLFGLRVGSNGDHGQGTEIGQGVWTAIDEAAFADANGNIRLRAAQTVLRFTGYGEFRPMPKLALALGMRAQYAWKPLLSFEQFSAGNYTVGRGYDPGALLGDKGLGTQIEVRYGSRIPVSVKRPAVEGYAFWDHTEVRSEGSVVIPGREHLNSIGAGARVNWNRFILDAGLAVPLTHLGPLNRRPDPRVLISLTTRLWPWRY